MSIIDKLLVLFDDEKQRSIDEVKLIYSSYTRQVISASLGRIVSKGWIEKKSDKYSITKKGRSVITNFLSNIDRIDNDKNIENCLFVIFRIPEKERINRDIMRNYLVSNGFGRLHNTVWIKFNTNDHSLKKLIKELNIEKQILTFSSKLSDIKIEEIINFTSWNSVTINNKYRVFIKNANNFLNKKNKKSIEARCLVFEFAKILCEDPIVPLRSKQNFRQMSFVLYKKIREHC